MTTHKAVPLAPALPRPRDPLGSDAAAALLARSRAAAASHLGFGVGRPPDVGPLAHLVDTLADDLQRSLRRVVETARLRPQAGHPAGMADWPDFPVFDLDAALQRVHEDLVRTSLVPAFPIGVASTERWRVVPPNDDEWQLADVVRAVRDVHGERQVLIIDLTALTIGPLGVEAHHRAWLDEARAEVDATRLTILLGTRRPSFHDGHPGLYALQRAGFRPRTLWDDQLVLLGADDRVTLRWGHGRRAWATMADPLGADPTGIRAADGVEALVAHAYDHRSWAAWLAWAGPAIVGRFAAASAVRRETTVVGPDRTPGRTLTHEHIDAQPISCP
jgi:hypothetical protein